MEDHQVPRTRQRSHSFRPRLLKGLVATAVAAVGFGALASFASAGTATAPRGPNGLAFYNPPSNLPSGPHGTLIWQRPAGGLVPLTSAAQTKLVLYTSRTPQGAEDAVSGSVSIPKGKPPKGGWPVITYAHGTTGSADICAPSRVHTGAPAESLITYVDPELNAWVNAGYAVVRTDYQGLGTPGPHPYLIGKSEGRSVLDIVRAARDVFPGIGKRFLIAGHSQGGQAALFAAGEAASWTPNLNLKGTVSYAPASHLLTQAKALPALTTPSSLTALATMIVQGTTTASANVDPSKLLTPQVKQFYPLLDQTCLPQLAQTRRLGGIAPADMLTGANKAPIYRVLDAENPDVTTAEPVFLAQGTADTTVFPQFTTSLSHELKALGDQVRYQQFHGVDHGGIVAAAEPDVLPWLEQRLPPGS
jgi:pimeloyl-ACP methyl ester carboxylesterase